jgi:hypothetical protein
MFTSSRLSYEGSPFSFASMSFKMLFEEWIELGNKFQDERNISFRKKLKLSHYTPWRHLGERRYSSYSLSTSAIDGGDWSASRPSRALPGRKDPGTHCTGGWVDLTADLGTEDRGKILSPLPEFPFVGYLKNRLPNGKLIFVLSET